VARSRGKSLMEVIPLPRKPRVEEAPPAETPAAETPAAEADTPEPEAVGS